MRNFINKKINKETYRMNFISTFDELNKLYEEVDVKKVRKVKKVKEADKEELTEAAEDEVVEVVEDEVPAEEPAIEEEPRQVICECDKCGALVIKDEADIVVDEESDLVNVEDECQFCEEAKGFKIIGVVAPYEAGEAEEPVEESLNNSKLLKEIEKTNELKTAHESEYLTLNEEAEDTIDEDLADVYRKKFDKPASTKTQQAWEDELNGEMGEISDKRRKHLEKKFAQQRDWEKRHAGDKGELEELLDANVNLDARGFGGSGNKVSVLSPGLESLDAKAAEDDEELEELLDANIKLDARGFGGKNNDVSIL
jgi:hypothetical protein